MNVKKLKRFNKYAVLVILAIAIPEIAGHFYFESQKHPVNSSLNAALSLTNSQHSMYPEDTTRCHLIMQNDTGSSNVTRVTGLHGQYGVYSCK